MKDHFDKNVQCLYGMLKRCELCPQKCRVDRTSGEIGICGLSDAILMDCCLAHHGEEPPLSGTRGAGMVFLSSCNLKCIYCQNYQISHKAKGTVLNPVDFARIMLNIQEMGCHNVELVTPTPQVPGIMDALRIARREGLTIPFVYNCGGYENPEVIKRLDGMVEIYLPDFKYGRDGDGMMFSGVGDYVKNAMASIQEMVRQAGDEGRLETDAQGIGKRGVMIRHLVLPGRTENSFAVLDLIKDHISLEASLCIMSQYTPIPSVRDHPFLGHRVTQREYDAVVNYAMDLGFDNLFIQTVDERTCAPDFNRNDPFDFDGFKDEG
ncbi:MAG: radical SAM protein [Deltaproteobacteria bacterium]|nr:radical SAM protein [Deltaproteobacteria bacterium]